MPSNSFLLSKLNPRFKRLWVVGDTDDKCICSTEFIPIVAYEQYYEFAFAILDSVPFYSYMINCSSSSTGSRKRMDPELCKKYIFAMPNDNSIIERFHEFSSNMIKMIIEKNKENGQLRKLRDDFLPLAINEKIKLTGSKII